jgi:hypothetical protein
MASLKTEPELKPMFTCRSCKTELPLENSIACELCDRDDEEDEEDDEEEDDKEVVDSVFKMALKSEEKKLPLFCKKCTLKCNACNVRGCKDCVEFVCCDCGYNMCYQCINNEIDCGCYGECYSCGVDINRGSEGWPCGECKKWYCNGCRQGDNSCKECGPEEEEEEEEEEEDKTI